MSLFDEVVCDCCKGRFQRLFAHLNQNGVCFAHYNLAHHSNESAATKSPIHIDDNNGNIKKLAVGAFRKGQGSSSRHRRFPVRGESPCVTNFGLPGEKLHCDQALNLNIEDDFVANDADHVFDSDEGNPPRSGQVGGEDGPDHSVLDLYLKLFKLQANPLCLELFSLEEKVQIQLLQLLRDLNCPLKAFTLILNWAAKSNASGHVFRDGCQPTRKKVISTLYDRYNMKGLTPKDKNLYLPYSQRVVNMVYFDARAVFASLLSCPTLNQDSHYLFDDAKDPFVAPSRTSSHVGDINTGRCYVETYFSLIKDVNVDMLLPCILAMDKTHIDMAGRLQMEPITISHGLLKHSIRSLPMAMRILGYINHSTPAHLPSESEFDIEFNNPTNLPKDTVLVKNPLPRNPNVSWATYLLNEAHMQIQFIFEESGFLKLQKHGFHWNLHYNNKVHPVVFHPYVPFIIGDTEGHDRLCGHYVARFAKVQQLCRICECPTQFTGYSKSKYRHRLPHRIDSLVKRGKTEQLQLLSQNYLKSGFADIRFGLHNNRGIFGACPGEMLHLISLGWFKYCLQAFSAQAGPTSVALKHYDLLCANLGVKMSRQSDRDIPRVNFPKGFSSASNLMGHEMAGCLLVKLFALHTTYFRGIFGVGKKRKVVTPGDEQRLRNEAHIADWELVVKCLLTWFQWMKQPKITTQQVRRSHKAIQWLMRVIADVAPRPGGMSNNTIKRHLVLHLREDILDHGVPDNVNSAYAESAHIPLAKITSRNTQKRAISFTKQAATRYVENLAISLASADMKTIPTISAVQDMVVDTEPTGSKSGRHYRLLYSDTGSEHAEFKWQRPRSTDNTELARLPMAVTKFLVDACKNKMPHGFIPGFTSFVDIHGNRYRAHPCYDGKAWNDYAMVEWEGSDEPEPVFIHTFVDLRCLAEGKTIDITSNGQVGMPGGLYAVAHCFDAVDPAKLEEANTLVGHFTEHFQRLEETRATLYLVDVESIRSPVLGIPDVPFGVKVPRRQRHHLFLIRGKSAWPQAWDAIIDLENACDKPDNFDDTVFEEVYEKRRKLDDGTCVIEAKSFEDFESDANAEKEQKEAAKHQLSGAGGAKRKHSAAEKARKKR